MEEIRKQKERIRGIYDFSYQLVREGELKELFQKALEMLERDFDYDYATIMLLDGRELEVVAERLRFRGGRSFLGKRLALGEGLSGWAAEHRQSVLVSDCSKDPRFVPSFEGIQSELIAPLLFGEELLGVVDIESRRKGAFKPEDEELLNSIAAQLAVAIREVRAREQLRGAYHIGQELAHYRTLKSLLNGILEILKEEFHYDYGAVMLRRGDELVVEAVRSTLADRKVDLGARIPLDQGVTGWVARHKRAALVNDVTQDSRYLMGHEEIRSELAVPIQIGDELLGVLNVESTAKNRFRHEDQEFLTSVAAQLAVAMAELRSRERLARAYQIGQELAKVEGVGELIDYITKQLERHFEYDYGLVFLREGAVLKLKGQLGRGGTRVFDRDAIEIGEGLIGWAAEHRESLLVNDVTQDPRYTWGFLETRSELVVPIHTPEELFGVLDIQSAEVGHFTEEDKLVLESIAGQMAIALSNLKRREELRELSIRDPLTGLYNRRYLNEIMARELERSCRYGHSLAFLMIDLDNFRDVNNRYGHLKGDEVLREIAELLLKNVRASDMVFRYGGDEFLILMPETDSEAKQAVSRLRRAMGGWNKRSGLDCKVGISIGMTSWSPKEERGIEEVLEEADRWMYQAKRQDRPSA
jgi:diguanylate cyclase (GGDEF)-like protein